MELLARTGVGRDINRHYVGEGELAEALERPVVKDLCRLIRWRNAHCVFDGEFEAMDSAEHELCLRWRDGKAFAQLNVNFSAHDATLCYGDGSGEQYFDLFEAVNLAEGV